jgi:hypothetical protein
LTREESVFFGGGVGDDLSRAVGYHEEMFQHVRVVRISWDVKVVFGTLKRRQKRHQVWIERRYRANRGVSRTRQLFFSLSNRPLKTETVQSKETVEGRRTRSKNVLTLEWLPG